MKFICEKKDLQKAVNTVSKAVAVKSVLPVLECILIQVTENNVTLKASDTTLSIKTFFSAKVSAEGMIAVPCRLFQEIISKYPEGDVSLFTEDNVLVLKSGSSTASLVYMSADEFPSFPEKDPENVVILSEVLFKKMINQAVFATAITDDKPILTGVLLEKEDNSLNIVALDGFRLALRKENVIATGSNMSVVVPAKTLRECAKVLEDTEKEIKICFSKKNVTVCFGRTEIYSRLLDGEYIKYKNIIQIDRKTLVKTNIDEFLTAIERASVFSREETNNLIKMSFSQDVIVITANSEMGKAVEKLPAEIEGKDLEIAFNAKYLSDVLKCMEESDVYLLLNTNVSPAIIKAKDSDKYLYLISPVQTRG